MAKKTKLQKFHKYGLRTVLYSLILSFALSSVFGIVSLMGSRASAAELIEDAFSAAKTQEAIINLGNTRDAVGNEIMKSSLIGGTSLSDYDPTMASNYRAPLIVRITKFLLRITIVLSITMVIYSGVMYIVEASKGAEVKETTDNLMYIIGGVLLALMSLGLVNLISSISISSLNITTRQGCMINSVLLTSADERLQEFICLRAGFGHPEEQTLTGGIIAGRDRNTDVDQLGGKHCLIAGERKKIFDSELQPKCIELGGERKE